MPALIRPAMDADAPQLHALRRKLFRESTTMLYEPDEFTATVDDERDRIRRFTDAPNCTYLVAETEGRLVGLLFAVGGNLRRLRHSTTLALGVSREYEGRGIGTALVARALAWSREAGIKRVELTVHTAHRRAVDLYLRCGFTIEGTRRASLRVDGQYVDEYAMSFLND